MRPSQRFNEAMVGWCLVTGSDCIGKGRNFSQCSRLGVAPELDLAFPWADLPADTTICDIGGGKGHVMQQILHEYPHLRVVVQDLYPVIKDTKKVSSDF
jgi:hypothetical protein